MYFWSLFALDCGYYVTNYLSSCLDFSPQWWTVVPWIWELKKPLSPKLLVFVQGDFIKATEMKVEQRIHQTGNQILYNSPKICNAYGTCQLYNIYNLFSFRFPNEPWLFYLYVVLLLKKCDPQILDLALLMQRFYLCTLFQISNICALMGCLMAINLSDCITVCS